MDYPRVGGEETRPAGRQSPNPGLPPRGRGRGMLAHGVANVRGITPAWAGKRLIPHLIYCHCQDYPRVGGEEICFDIDVYYIIGLPPRGRGRGRRGCLMLGNLRITPAWAGKRMCLLVMLRPFRDYPRVGGEASILPRNLCPSRGLPPRGRGRGPLWGGVGFDRGITPAWAEKRRADGAWWLAL